MRLRYCFVVFPFCKHQELLWCCWQRGVPLDLELLNFELLFFSKPNGTKKVPASRSPRGGEAGKQVGGGLSLGGSEEFLVTKHATLL